MYYGRWAVSTAMVAVALALGGCISDHKPVMSSSHQAGEETALDAYVKAADPSYSYSLTRSYPGEGYTGYAIHIVSQRYLDEQTIDRPYWEHDMYVAVPDAVKSSTGFLYITGGDNGDMLSGEFSPFLANMALTTGTVVAELHQVPNQPLVFVYDDDQKRGEDGIIAYTWDKYLRTGDEKWPLRLPMTKAAVKAMDTITDFVGKAPSSATVNQFVVSGGSKRGWTAWTTAAVDDRVVGVMPIVIDMLNVVPSFAHHWSAYGKWAEAVGDYETANLMNWTGSEEYTQLMNLVEPYSYRDRYTMPKYIINASGDQFFLPDSSQFYWDDLPAEKSLRYVPNADHGLGGSDTRESMLAWYNAVVKGEAIPEYSWELDSDGAIHVHTDDNPSQVRLWRATNPKARNFQKQTIGEAWTSVALPDLGGGNYLGRVEPPATGWTAFFVELTFPSSAGVPFKFTTQVNVLPDVYPFEYHYPSEKDHAVGFLHQPVGN